MSLTAVRPKVWILAARPKTLGAAIAPVLVGTAMAVEAGAFHGGAAGFALLGALLIQVGVNYHNDYYDFLKGADTEDRVGPTRVTQAGLVDPSTMRRATIAVFAAAVGAGLYLIARGGWPVLAIGVASIAAAVAYTAGRYALAYTGLADLFVFVFFGPVAVGGTYYVQALSITPEVLAAGAGPGLLSVGILLVNNIRDVDEDRRAGKRTLVVRMGRMKAVALYAACGVGTLCLPCALYVWTGQHPWGMLTLVLAPLLVRPVRTLATSTDPEILNPLLGVTGRLLLFWSVLFAVGWNL
jgi:1,4-dihydroxy-2-naphthoate octaprenyltransferase